ncbi:MAG: helical backbone metal receptor [candidate division WOR-3 bacterium]|nr:helical backbone metal receptor [candidate division WOR-3 bacterium]
MRKSSLLILLIPILFSIHLFSYESIISAAPNITESLIYLGQKDKLAGRTDYCDFPGLSHIPVAGSYTSLNFEEVLRINPDIVIFSGNLTDNEALFLENQGIDYIDIPMEDYRTVHEGMEYLSEITDADRGVNIEPAADSLIELFNRAECSVYIEISNNPLMAATEHSYAGSILKAAGFDIMTPSAGPYSTVSQELIIDYNPDIIIVMSKDHDISSRMGWTHIEAVKKNRIIYSTDSEIDALSRPGPRLLEAIDILRGYIESIED